MSDTTRDPIIAARSPLPWASWQRSEDYYSEGSLVWLDVDTRIRALTGNDRSLDDFARQFFGSGRAGDWETSTYNFDDLVCALDHLVPFDWTGYFVDKLEHKTAGAPLAGIERGGYRLVYRDRPTDYWSNVEQVASHINLTFSLGMIAGLDGKLEDVLWEGPAFRAGLTTGSTIIGVNGSAYSPAALRDAVANGPIDLHIRSGKTERVLCRARIRAVARSGSGAFPRPATTTCARC